MMAPEKEDLNVRAAIAQDIVREAGEVARMAFLDRNGLSVTTKGTQDWVTNVDLEVETLIRQRLQASFPDDVVLGEEGGQSAASDSGTMWIVDPIDGTTCFLLGIPQWCVVLCYVADTAPVLAAIYDPMADHMYSAVHGGGAFLDGVAIRAAQDTNIRGGLVSIGASIHDDPQKSASFISELVNDGGMYLRIGACALGLCYVASGRLLAVFEPLVSPWDDLAGMLIVREAGGYTTPYPKTIATDKRHPVLAAGPGIWPRMQSLL